MNEFRCLDIHCESINHDVIFADLQDKHFTTEETKFHRDEKYAPMRFPPGCCALRREDGMIAAAATYYSKTLTISIWKEVESSRYDNYFPTLELDPLNHV
uniref:GNAT family N-acetyltransferase n=1 Tax=Caenorhabditis tropicalis TaxID=1561998 RepID=A0A1I7TQ34_9PELO